MSVTLQMFVAIYQWPANPGTMTSISSQTFETEAAARRKPRGPFVPHGIKVIEVVPVRYRIQNEPHK